MAVLTQAGNALLAFGTAGAGARRRAWWTLVLLALQPLTAEPIAQEYRLKAVFLFNFVQFVEWPPQAFASPEAPFVIGVLGEDPFGPALDETVRGESFGSHRLEVRRVRRVEEVDACQMLFVSRSESARLGKIIQRLGSRGILTVSDAEGFARQGGMIRFVTEKNRVRLKVNLQAARAAGLTLSSKLLRPAEIVTGPTD